MSKHRRKRQRRHAASIRPKRAIVERLTRELRRSRVRPEVLEQAAVAFAIILRDQTNKTAGNRPCGLEK